MSSFNASLECLESGASFGLSTNRFLSIEERGLQSMKGSFAEPSDGVRDCKSYQVQRSTHSHTHTHSTVIRE